MIGILKGIIPLSNVLTLIVMSFFINNVSRKTIFLLALSFEIIGSLILIFSWSILMGTLGLFIIGFGNIATFSYGIAVISEITQDSLGKKMVGILNPTLTIGNVFLSGVIGAIRNWRQTSLYFFLIPYLILFISTFILFKDTPQSLLKTKPAKEIA